MREWGFWLCPQHFLSTVKEMTMQKIQALSNKLVWWSWHLVNGHVVDESEECGHKWVTACGESVNLQSIISKSLCIFNMNCWNRRMKNKWQYRDEKVQKSRGFPPLNILCPLKSVQEYSNSLNPITRKKLVIFIISFYFYSQSQSQGSRLTHCILAIIYEQEDIYPFTPLDDHCLSWPRWEYSHWNLFGFLWRRGWQSLMPPLAPPAAGLKGWGRGCLWKDANEAASPVRCGRSS
jgi:hypothetical protein